MRGAWIIAKREIVSFFVSPLAYVVLTSWVFLMGIQFWLLCAFRAEQAVGSGGMGDSPLKQFFGGTTLFWLAVIVFVPLLTMRLLAEESRAGTIEPLLTAPVSEVSVVLGKYAAAMVIWIAMFVPTLMYVWLTSRYGDVDLGAIGATYFGVWMLGLSWMALGLLASTIARNQIVAAMIAFVLVGGHFIVGLFGFVFTDDGPRQAFELVSVWQHLDSYGSGIVDTRYLVFDLSIAFLAIFLAVRVLEARRYEG